MNLKKINLLFFSLLLLNCNNDNAPNEEIILEEPTNSTLQVQDLHTYSAKIIGELISFGDYNTINHGFVLARNPEPTIDNISISLGSIDVLGEFHHSFENLDPNTDYYVRSFIEYGDNFIKYGNTLTFRTLATNVWIEKSPILEGYRAGAVSFVVNDRLFIGSGFHDIVTNTFSEYDYQNNSWAEISSLPSNPRTNAISFGIGDYGYVGLGLDNTSGFNYLNDLWRYNPTTNRWTIMANFPGEARAFSTCFVIEEKAYVTGGSTGNHFDLWEYDSASNIWTQKADYPGVCNTRGNSFSLNNKGYVGFGWNGAISCNELWEYNPSTDSWTQKQNFPGSPRHSAISFSLIDKGYIACGVKQGGGNSTEYLTDFWEYEPITDSWSQIDTSFPGKGRNEMIVGVIENKVIIGLGANSTVHFPSARFDDIWEYALEIN